MGKAKLFIIIIGAILLTILITVTITMASHSLKESDRTIERIDRKIELYTKGH